MKIFRMIGLAVVAILMCVNFSSCKDDDDDAKTASIVGSWVDVEDPDYTVVFTSSNFEFLEDGDLEYSGTYSLSGNKISLTIKKFPGGEQYVGTTETYDVYELTENTLKFGDDGADDPDYNFKRVK